ncbi:succinate dehydrogenase [ubiquinone] cytochrome b small subunit, mitochondrial-like [Liolophura sinensis]|uniref:succinate dehydrogenase [ubiquinone] cytochrome b small subunit, mitochondrial-like n=1 Tax=Liolophura sinensis TaxID=3198878 RepID=UPI0031593829
MAALTLLRSCRGKGCLLLLKPNTLSTLGMSDVSRKSLAFSSPVLAMFKAHRGPYTPAEKQGSGHVMTAATHWSVERAVTVSLLAILPAALFVQGPIMDYALATSVVLHGYWGLHGVATDYVTKFVPRINILTNIVTVLALGGLYYFNYADVGVCKAIEMVWSL